MSQAVETIQPESDLRHEPGHKDEEGTHVATAQEVATVRGPDPTSTSVSGSENSPDNIQGDKVSPLLIRPQAHY